MRRRQFNTFLGSLAAASAVEPSLVGAQQKAMPVIGFLSSLSAARAQRTLPAFLQGLGESGYVEGQTVAIEYRWAEGRYERLPGLVSDLIGRKVDLIVAVGGPPPALAAKAAGSAIPIVFVSGGDPVADGVVASLAQPGANITGVSFLAAELTAKRLELVSEMVPQAKSAALLANPNNPNTDLAVRNMMSAAESRGLQPMIVKGDRTCEIDAAFAALVQKRAGALVVAADPVFAFRRQQIVALATRHAIPTIFFDREDADAGGLISYGPSVPAAYRQGGVYAGRVLKGTKPADLPVLQPTTFEMVVNLKTARALGLAVSPTILARADEVIE
jgi:putative tryptophan/tyrosine transport system substrate-binding protein